MTGTSGPHQALKIVSLVLYPVPRRKLPYGFQLHNRCFLICRKIVHADHSFTFPLVMPSCLADLFDGSARSMRQGNKGTAQVMKGHARESCTGHSFAPGAFETLLRPGNTPRIGQNVVRPGTLSLGSLARAFCSKSISFRSRRSSSDTGTLTLRPGVPCRTSWIEA